MELYGSLFLAIVLLLLYPLRPIRGFYKKHSIPFNFTVTLLATFIGVYLSIQASNKSNAQKDREDAAGLLDKLTQNAHNKIRIASRVYMFSRGAEIRKEDVLLLYPHSLKAMVSNDIAIRNFSPQFIISIDTHLSLLELTVQDFLMNKREATAQKKFQQDYADMLKKLVIMLTVEQYYIRGKIDKNTHEILYRCSLDPARVPLTERGIEESGCQSQYNEIKKNLPKKLIDLEKQLDDMYPSNNSQSEE